MQHHHSSFLYYSSSLFSVLYLYYFFFNNYLPYTLRKTHTQQNAKEKKSTQTKKYEFNTQPQNLVKKMKKQ